MAVLYRKKSKCNVMNINNRRAAARLVWTCLLLGFALSVWVAGAWAGSVPPSVDLNGDDPGVEYSATFTEDEGAEPIVSVTGLRIDNGEDTIVTAAKVTLTNQPDTVQESLAADPGATGLNVAYSAESGELTIKGNSSVSNYEQVLRTLTYNNSSQSPDITDRIVLVTVSDGQLTSQPVTSTVAINSINDAPVLDSSGNMILAGINEDDRNSNGNSVTTIIKSAETGGEDRITDADEGSPEGFAVIEAGSSNGAWQYSINSGITWQPFGAVSNTSAVLLDGAARIRFVPNVNFNGSASFLFRAWDQSGGRPSGDTGVDVSLNGGITPFSAESEMVTINIQSVNDLPLVDLNGAAEGVNYASQFYESGPPAPVADLAAAISDEDHAALASLIITLTNRPDGASESLTAVTTGTGITAAPYDPATGRLTLSGPDSVANFQSVLRQVTYTNSSVGPSTVARVVTVIANDGVSDGPMATATIAINPVNSAPVLDPAASLSLGDIPEDAATPAGAPIGQILAAAGDPITDPDSGAMEGVAVIGVDSSHGQWQYNLTNPPAGEVGWMPVGVVSDTAALLLSDAAWIRFVPAADYFGQSGDLTIRAWDRTSGSNGQRDVNASANGGNTAFSANTNKISVVVAPVNDLPVLSGLPGEPLLYVEDAAPLPLAADGLTLTDVDSVILSSATVRLTNPLDGDAEWLMAVVDGTGITATYEDGLLLLSGGASPAVYQQVLRTVTYWNASQDPDPAARMIELAAADSTGSGPAASVVVHVQPVNDPPEIDLDGIGPGQDYAATFLINRGPVPIVAESMVVTDIDNTTLKAATIRIVNPKNGQAEILSANLSGVANIKSSFDVATGVLSLTGVDSLANYQKVLRTLAYNNTLPQPDTEARVIEFVLADSAGSSEPRMTTLSFAEAPTVRHYMPMISWAYRRSEEPNDVCSQAMGLRLNVDEPFRADDKDDWFFFDLTAPSDVVVELHDFVPRFGQIVVAGERQPGQGCGGLQLLGNNGSSALDKIVNLGPRSAGRYYVWVINDGAQDANSVYRLFVRAVPTP